MEKKVIIITLLITLFFTISIFGETYVLIMGAANYRYDGIIPLPAAKKDALLLKEALIQLEVASEEKITYIENPVLTDIKINLKEFLKKGGENDRLIVYFSGHSEVEANEQGKQDTYLCGIDVRKNYIRDTAYNFRENFENLSETIKAKETVMIFDTCYAGGLTKERKLDILRIENKGFEAISQNKGINFLFSSGPDETSQEMGEDRGGWYTHHLLEGLKGEANLDGDDYITLNELSIYVQQKVQQTTKNQQNPISMIVNKDLRLLKDKSISINQLILEMTNNYVIKNGISQKEFELYIKILNQNAEQDSEEEKRIREELYRYSNHQDLEYLRDRTRNYFSNYNGKTTGDDETESPQTETRSAPQPQESNQRQGTCYLKLTAANEQAKGAQIYIDGEYAGTLETGTILIERLTKAIHTITIEGEKIEREEIEITFDNDYMMVTKAIEAQTAKRKLLIITDPPGATLEINGTQQNEKTPVMIEVTIEQEHHIKLTKDGYKETELTVKEESKGEPKRIETTLIANKAPNTPILIAPTGNQEETTTELKWHCTDPEGDAIAYEIYIAETGQPLEKETETKATTNAENSYTLTNLKANTQYTWQIIAKDEWRQTKGTIWQFKTKTILTKQIKIETEPPNADI